METAMNSSSPLQFSNNGTSLDFTQFYTLACINMIILILGLPINSYVVRLIITGAGSGVAPELFALNLSVCEIIICINIVPAIFFILSYTIDALNYIIGFLSTILVIGRPFFQCCVCVERYVAVVHPVVFLKYKPLRFRVAISAVMWLLVLGICAFCPLLSLRTMYHGMLAQYLILFSVKGFCSVAVLKALRRPGPGEKWSAKDAEANRMKKRAFWVILIILLTMVLVYTPMVIYILMFDYLSDQQKIHGISVCFDILVVAGLVQPLLYLHRAGKLPLLWLFNTIRVQIQHALLPLRF